MSFLKQWITHLVTSVHYVKNERLKWQQQNQGLRLQLQHERMVAERQLEASLSLKAIELEQQISALKSKNKAELTMLKIKYEQDIKDYKQYLKSLEQLKLSIQQNYKHLPDALAFTIHHHAKELLNKMWEAKDLQEKIDYELQLIKLMAAIHDDAKHSLLNQNATQALPEKTLKLLKKEIHI